MKQTHPQGPGGCPHPQLEGTEQAAALTLGQALAAQRGEEEKEEEGADQPGCLRHAALQEGCSVAPGQSCRLMGSGLPGGFYGGAAGLVSPWARGCVDRGRTWPPAMTFSAAMTWFPAMSQSTQGEQY